MGLANGLKTITRGLRPFSDGRFRELLNWNFARCITRIQEGPGVKVTLKRMGMYEVRASDQLLTQVRDRRVAADASDEAPGNLEEKLRAKAKDTAGEHWIYREKASDGPRGDIWALGHRDPDPGTKQVAMGAIATSLLAGDVSGGAKLTNSRSALNQDGKGHIQSVEAAIAQVIQLIGGTDIEVVRNGQSITFNATGTSSDVKVEISSDDTDGGERLQPKLNNVDDPDDYDAAGRSDLLMTFGIVNSGGDEKLRGYNRLPHATSGTSPERVVGFDSNGNQKAFANADTGGGDGGHFIKRINLADATTSDMLVLDVDLRDRVVFESGFQRYQASWDYDADGKNQFDQEASHIIAPSLANDYDLIGYSGVHDATLYVSSSDGKLYINAGGNPDAGDEDVIVFGHYTKTMGSVDVDTQ